MIERGKHIGRRVDKPTQDNAGDMERCPDCGQWFNPADLGEVFEHAHGPIPVRIKRSGLRGPLPIPRRKTAR